MIGTQGGPRSVADDAAIIEESWLDPECFAVVFDRHAPCIHRYLAWVSCETPQGRGIGRELYQELGARPATPGDVAAWRRAGSPDPATTMLLEEESRAGKPARVYKPGTLAQYQLYPGAGWSSHLPQSLPPLPPGELP